MPPNPTKKTCSEPECDRVVLGRGLCNKHYHQKWRKAELPVRQRPAGHRYLLLTFSLSREQLLKVNRLLAHRQTNRAAFYREVLDFYLERLSPEEREVIAKPMPVKSS